MMSADVKAKAWIPCHRVLAVVVTFAAVFSIAPSFAQQGQGLSAETREKIRRELEQMSPAEQQRFFQELQSGRAAPMTAGQPDVSRPQVVTEEPMEGEEEATTEEAGAEEEGKKETGAKEGEEEGTKKGEKKAKEKEKEEKGKKKKKPEEEEKKVSLFGELMTEEEAKEELEKLTPLERRMNQAIGTAELEVEPVPKAVRQRLKQFGYGLFKGTPLTFAPATEIPVPVDYVLGPGDTIEVQLYGKENQIYRVPVSRDGVVNIPEIGPVNVAGLQFQEVREELTQRITSQIIGVNVSVSLGELRSMRVFVLGDVRRPGSYVVSSLSTMTNALFVSGGIQPIGSLRRIQLKRNGELVGSLDLYDLLLRGDTSGDERLRPGDVIFVPPIGPAVGVAGEVRRPAIYELNEEAALDQVLALAGGLLPTAYRESIQIEHVSGASGREVEDVNMDVPAERRTAVSDGDIVRIYSPADRMGNLVLLSGHVQRPGGYQWYEGMRITDLIPSMDALLPASDPGYVLIRREVPPTRRVSALSVDLREALQAPGSAADAPLERRDQVFVFGMVEDRSEVIEPLIEELRSQARQGDPEPIVSVAGHVAHPGEFPLEPGMTVADLIRAAGGLSQEAFTLSAELTRFDLDPQRRGIETFNIELSGAATGQPTASFALAPFDSLQIKPVPEWYERETILVAGEVRFPGEYTIKRGETLSQLIERVGGLTPLAYPEGAIFSRQLLRERESQELDRLQQQLRTDLAQLSLEEIQKQGGNLDAIAAAEGVLQELQQAAPVGRLVINLPDIRDGKSEDVLLRGGDTLFVPRIPQEVTVIGEVAQSTSHLYVEGLDRDDYLDRSGGTTAKADTGRIYIVRANGAVIASPHSRWFGAGSQQVEPGDVIVVPLDVTRLRPLELWTSIAQIMQSLALTIAAANSVGVL